MSCRGFALVKVCTDWNKQAKWPAIWRAARTHYFIAPGCFICALKCQSYNSRIILVLSFNIICHFFWWNAILSANYRYWPLPYISVNTKIKLIYQCQHSFYPFAELWRLFIGATVHIGIWLKSLAVIREERSYCDGSSIAIRPTISLQSQ